MENGGLPALVRKDRSTKGRAGHERWGARILLRLAMPPGRRGCCACRRCGACYEEEREWASGGIRNSSATSTRDIRRRGAADAGAVAGVSTDVPDLVRPDSRDAADAGARWREAYKNREEIISHRDIAAVEPLDYVVMDHRRLDVFALVKERGAWKLVRPWLTAAIDMRTRKWLGWCIVETPSSDSIAARAEKAVYRFRTTEALFTGTTGAILPASGSRG